MASHTASPTFGIACSVLGAVCVALFAWSRRQSQRTTKSNAAILAGRREPQGKGIMIGVVDETQTSAAESAFYLGRKVPDMRGGA